VLRGGGCPPPPPDYAIRDIPEMYRFEVDLGDGSSAYRKTFGLD
jgi:hypothetical protein